MVDVPFKRGGLVTRLAELTLSVEGGGVVPLRRVYRVVVSVGVASKSGGVAGSSLDEGCRRTGFAIRLFSVGEQPMDRQW